MVFMRRHEQNEVCKMLSELQWKQLIAIIRFNYNFKIDKNKK